MRWSKLKQKVEANFADDVRKKLAIHSTTYGDSTCGHAWLTLDGNVIANFCTRAFFNRFEYGDKDRDRGLSDTQIEQYQDQLVDYGELSRQNVYEACWAFVHDLGFDQSLKSDDPLIQSLAVLDKRLGKRRYGHVAAMPLHPLARKLFDLRVSEEGRA
ncbi:MAG: hypothetical protein AAF221_04535 [Pseudomonadota bacterium]